MSFSPILFLFCFFMSCTFSQVPVVGWTPLKSLEQLGAFGVFGIYQLLQSTAIVHKKKLLGNISLRQVRIRAVAVAGAIGFVRSAPFHAQRAWQVTTPHSCVLTSFCSTP